MKKIVCLILVLLMSITLSVDKVEAAITNAYYGSGNYVSSAPVKPTGLKFYVDYSAISTYGSSPFSSIFNWNGNYNANVAAVAQYPASASAYPTYFAINTDSSMLSYVKGETFYFNSAGNCINGTVTYPMDQSNIYKCRISLNSDKSVFNVNNSFSTTYLQKVIIHEVGHVFLLKHPSNNYFSSVMHQGAPSGQIAANVTNDDRNNLIEKWGN